MRQAKVAPMSTGCLLIFCAIVFWPFTLSVIAIVSSLSWIASW